MSDKERISELAKRLSSSGYFAKGGKIHIKPSHRGKLTELKKRTGKSEAELYNDGNPAHKKMVVFARNTRKWKHGDGGLLRQYPGGGNMVGQFAFVASVGFYGAFVGCYFFACVRCLLAKEKKPFLPLVLLCLSAPCLLLLSVSLCIQEKRPFFGSLFLLVFCFSLCGP